MNLLRKSLAVNPDAAVVVWGHFFLRVTAGLMIFFIHGLHKLEGGVAYLRHGTPWMLVTEVAEMHFPAPVVSAFAATVVQLVCSLFLIVGLFTRINAVLLAGALGGAILQNLLAHRDPQLALLYTAVVATFALMGGGRYSLDARLSGRFARKPLLVSPVNG